MRTTFEFDGEDVKQFCRQAVEERILLAGPLATARVVAIEFEVLPATPGVRVRVIVEEPEPSAVVSGPKP